MEKGGIWGHFAQQPLGDVGAVWKAQKDLGGSVEKAGDCPKELSLGAVGQKLLFDHGKSIKRDGASHSAPRKPLPPSPSAAPRASQQPWAPKRGQQKG